MEHTLVKVSEVFLHVQFTFLALSALGLSNKTAELRLDGPSTAKYYMRIGSRYTIWIQFSSLSGVQWCKKELNFIAKF